MIMCNFDLFLFSSPLRILAKVTQKGIEVPEGVLLAHSLKASQIYPLG